MVKSNLSTLSLFISFVLAICSAFILPDAVVTLGFESVKKFFTDFPANANNIKVLFLAAFVGVLVLNVLFKFITVASCKKLCNVPVFVLDVALVVLSVLVFTFSPADVFIFVFTFGFLAVMFDFLFFYAEM